MQLGEFSLSTATERRYTLCVAPPLSSLALSSLALVQALASHGSGRAVRRRGAALERSALAACARDDGAQRRAAVRALCAGHHRPQVRTQRRGRCTALSRAGALEPPLGRQPTPNQRHQVCSQSWRRSRQRREALELFQHAVRVAAAGRGHGRCRLARRASSTPEIVTISERAMQQLESMQKSQGLDELILRLGVRAGGCVVAPFYLKSGMAIRGS